MTQPGKVANSARGQLERKHDFSSPSPFAPGKFGPSRPAVSLVILRTQAESGASCWTSGFDP